MEQLGLFPDNLLSSTKVLFVNFGNSSAEVAYKHLIKLRDKKISCEPSIPNEAKLNKQIVMRIQKALRK